MKKHNYLVLSILFFCMFSAFSQIIPKKLDSLLTRKVDSMRIVLKAKSLSVAIQLPNNLIWTAAKGISSETPFVQVKPNDTYLIGSITKTMTSACILQLADEKKLNLDDEIHKWVDTIQYINPNITIRQLLRHQSGIYDVLQNSKNQPAMLANKDSIWTLKNLIKTFIKPATFQAGASWDYSNTNYFLLAMIIEKATGKPYYEEYRKRFFTPLAMNSIKIPAFEGLPTNIAHVWIDLNGDGLLDDAHKFYTGWKSLNAEAGPAGGYYATASEVSLWMRSYLKGQFVSAEKMTEAKQTVVATTLTSGTRYGLGLMERTFSGIKAYGHGGDLSYSGMSWYFPEKDISITVLNNDSKVISWSLLPVVNELLKVYTKNENLLSVATSELENERFDVRIAPNPFEKSLDLSIKLPLGVSALKLSLINEFGQEIVHVEKKNVERGVQKIAFENLENLNDGFYFVKIIVDGEIAKVLKVVKI
jgi:D-alanyl-D-alanine carboxypeptidase